MSYSFLDFEKPISLLEKKIEDLRSSQDQPDVIQSQVDSLNKEIIKITKELYSNLSIWQKVQVARHPHRPHFSDYIEKIFHNFDEHHGDRNFGDDRAIIGGTATFKGKPVMLIGHEKGKDTNDKIERNFGMSQPEGYRKAARLMKLAEDFSMPVITFIDTPGAYPGIESEERGNSQAIAYNLSVMSKLKTPIIVIITGEGGSGGALAIGVGDNIAMLEYSIYSVASPEACASIVWRDSSKAEDAAKAMKLDASNLLELSLIDKIIDEPLGGAHRDIQKMSSVLSDHISEQLEKCSSLNISDLLNERHKKIMSYGAIE